MKVFVRERFTDKILLKQEEVGEKTIFEIKKEIFSNCKNLPVEQQGISLSHNAKILRDDQKLADLVYQDPSKSIINLYVRKFGPRIGYRTVFIAEYSLPLCVYLLIWVLRQPLAKGFSPLAPITTALHLRNLAAICWAGHYIKRLLETIFVHRFSHATMPLKNLFMNCSYYSLFAAFVAYFVNHPLYTPPVFAHAQIAVGLSIFLIGEWGNLSCHLALKCLRPAGSAIRKIPYPMRGWYCTSLFNYVACPNYTFETLSWFGFSIMTQSLPAVLFMMAGFGIMSRWALGKLKAYRSEFPDFPRNRTAIVPFIL